MLVVRNYFRPRYRQIRMRAVFLSTIDPILQRLNIVAFSAYPALFKGVSIQRHFSGCFRATRICGEWVITQNVSYSENVHDSLRWIKMIEKLFDQMLELHV